MTNFENAKVQVAQGWLQGYTEGKLKIFKGIPYAAPPVGALRFRHPQDPGRWRGVRKATAYSAASIQHVMENPEMPANVHGVPQFLAPSQYEEDCLYLNIWTPAQTSDARLPVFVWIHGGGMVAGSGCEVVCDGTGFASRKDVVVVTINYRLGFLGFFAHPDLTAETGGTSGNYALYDMRKACQWVKQNIAQFGGDPDRITVAGQSGGAAGTGALHASPLMKGLVNRVSIESGPIYWGFMQPEDRSVLEQRGIAFMEYIGCKSIEELRSRDAWELYDAYTAFVGDQGMAGGFSFCVDGEFLPKRYSDIMDAGCPHCAEMPYVFGRVDKGERNPFFDYHWVGADYDFMELIQGYWYDFCASGDPNGEGRPVWKKYAEKFDICELCNHTHMIPADQMDKYRYFYEKLTENNFIVSLFGLPRFTPKNG